MRHARVKELSFVADHSRPSERGLRPGERDVVHAKSGSTGEKKNSKKMMLKTSENTFSLNLTDAARPPFVLYTLRISGCCRRDVIF